MLNDEITVWKHKEFEIRKDPWGNNVIETLETGIKGFRKTGCWIDAPSDDFTFRGSYNNSSIRIQLRNTGEVSRPRTEIDVKYCGDVLYSGVVPKILDVIERRFGLKQA